MKEIYIDRHTNKLLASTKSYIEKFTKIVIVMDTKMSVLCMLHSIWIAIKISRCSKMCLNKKILLLIYLFFETSMMNNIFTTSLTKPYAKWFWYAYSLSNNLITFFGITYNNSDSSTYDKRHLLNSFQQILQFQR